MLFGRRIDEMLVANPASKGGSSASYVTYLDSSGLDSLVTLAPYYLPLFTLPLLPLRLVMDSWPQALTDFLIGFTLAFHYASLIDELLMQRFGLGQPDITNTGLIFSYVIIGLMNLVFLAIIKATLQEEWPSTQHLVDFVTRSWESYVLIFQQIWDLFFGR
jgi:hypothetical protein